MYIPLYPKKFQGDRRNNLPETLYSRWLRRDLNLRPWAYESPALTTELLSRSDPALLERFQPSQISISEKAIASSD